MLRFITRRVSLKLPVRALAVATMAVCGLAVESTAEAGSPKPSYRVEYWKAPVKPWHPGGQPHHKPAPTLRQTNGYQLQGYAVSLHDGAGHRPAPPIHAPRTRFHGGY